MRALVWLGLILIFLGIMQVVGIIALVPCGASIFGLCLNPIVYLQNLILGIIFVGLGAFLLTRGMKRR